MMTVERKYAAAGRRTEHEQAQHARLVAQREALQERLFLLTNRIERLQFCPHGADVIRGYCDNCKEGGMHDPDPDGDCRAEYVTGSAHDPYGTFCDQPAGHYPASAHEGSDPLSEPGDGRRVAWRGGGSCAGDSLPYRDVRHFHRDDPEPDPARTEVAK